MKAKVEIYPKSWGLEITWIGEDKQYWNANIDDHYDSEREARAAAKAFLERNGLEEEKDG